VSDTAVIWPEATERLRADAAFGPVVEEVGPVLVPVLGDPHFPYLARAIVYQQLAGRAAATIHGRLVDALGGDVTPGAILDTPEDALRGAGLSRAKLASIRDLAEKVSVGEVLLEELDGLDDDAVKESLVRVRGIGPWTADMFLMFKLRRPDVWPTGDLGVRAGWAQLHGLEDAPPARELGPLGDPYRPWRSAAAWYCWRALEVTLP
jgi:3-methyladenine DNA glycosylase/8-oxoguanine DNA glycosylase